MPLMHALAIAVLAAFLAFVGGCVKGKHASESDRMVLAAQLQIANGNVDACAASLSEFRDHAADELSKAEGHEQATAQALESVVKENLALSDQLWQAERALSMAMQESTCRQQLEMELCPSVPLL